MTADAWERIRLGTLGTEIKGNTKPQPDVEYEMYSVPAFADGAPEILSGREIGSSKREVAAGDLLLCKINPRINRVWWVSPPERGRAQLASSEYLVLRLYDENRNLLPYLVWYLRSPRFRDWIKLNVEGATGSHTRAKSPTILEQIVPIAPEFMRDAIVAEIEKQFTRLDAAVVAMKRLEARLQRYRSSVISAACSGRLLTSHPKTWARAKLSELGVIDRGVSKHRPRNDPSLFGGPYPFIQTGDVRRANVYIRNHRQTYSEAGLAQSKLWPAGTLCITIAANIAETAILTFPACFPDSVVGFQTDSPVLVRWVELFFRLTQSRLSETAPATAQKNINLALLRGLEVPVASLEEQEAIVAEVDRRLSVVDELEVTAATHLVRAGILRQSILERAFLGRLISLDVDSAGGSS